MAFLSKVPSLLTNNGRRISPAHWASHSYSVSLLVTPPGLCACASNWSGVGGVWRSEPCAVWGCEGRHVCRGEKEPVWKEVSVRLHDKVRQGWYRVGVADLAKFVHHVASLFSGLVGSGVRGILSDSFQAGEQSPLYSIKSAPTIHIQSSRVKTHFLSQAFQTAWIFLFVPV